MDISSTEQPRIQSPGPVVTQRRNPRMPQGDEYGPHNPRRSQRARKPRHASSELSVFGYPQVGGGGVTEPQ